ncbi:hypothetical protein [Actinomadura macrotermitis]|uniref:Uncharacterized protein n=1 Tax=Actinomadura macrotermitis TaxID=2585200 RepID=A0A7K0C4R5_9ACTN|nr:hypothetical protein [Actinomadura macrotermitis]MQY08112.1 hypothetical protein [Actinomadura macrotermitis]
MATDLEIPVPAPLSEGRWPTPVWLRALTAVAVVAALLFGASVAAGVIGLRAGVRGIARDAAPQAALTADLHVRLTAMDARLADALRIGRTPGRAGALTAFEPGRASALTAFEQARDAATADLRQISAATGGADARAAVQTALDGLVRYQAAAAQALLLSEQAGHGAGKAPEPVLDRFRQATDLLHVTMLPAVDRLTAINADRVEKARRDGSHAAERAFGLAVLFGLPLCGTLIAVQLLLYRRQHRMLNPAVLPASLLAFVLTVSALQVTGGENERLRSAKEDAFDSVLVLGRARALAHAAADDESRFLLDPKRRDQYLTEFTDDSQALAWIDADSMSDYRWRLDGELRFYRSSDRTKLGGSLGTALRNVTYPGEHERATGALAALIAYHQGLQETRDLVVEGKRDEAVRLDDADAQEKFAALDRELTGWLELNRGRLDGSLAAADRSLGGWTWPPPAGAVLIAGLLLLGVRPRLAEYR